MVAFKHQVEKEQRPQAYHVEISFTVDIQETRNMLVARVCTDAPRQIVDSIIEDVHGGGWSLASDEEAGIANPHNCPDHFSHKHYYFHKELS